MGTNPRWNCKTERRWGNVLTGVGWNWRSFRGSDGEFLGAFSRSISDVKIDDNLSGVSIENKKSTSYFVDQVQSNLMTWGYLEHCLHPCLSTQCLKKRHIPRCLILSGLLLKKSS